MTRSELKSRLHKLIDSIENIETLSALYVILNTKTNTLEEAQAHYISKPKLSAKIKTLKKNTKKKEDYTKPGKPMSMEAYAEMIKKAQTSKSISHADLLKEMKLWD